jgi:hypothetical protein
MPFKWDVLEDGPETIRRRRLLAQLDLSFAELTAEQNAAVDVVCSLLPLVDEPQPLSLLPDESRPAVTELLRRLPQTHVITRLLEGRGESWS